MKSSFCAAATEKYGRYAVVTKINACKTRRDSYVHVHVIQSDLERESLAAGLMAGKSVVDVYYYTIYFSLATLIAPHLIQLHYSLLQTLPFSWKEIDWD